MDSLQGIQVDYELDTFNTPPQGQLYVTPKIGYVDAMPLFRSRYRAFNSPQGHFNGDNARFSTRRTKLTVTPKFISSNGNMAFAKLQRTQSLARPTTRAAFLNFLITPFRLLTHKLSYETCSTKKQTQYSLLQIKTILKTHSDYRHLTSSSSFHFSQSSKEVTKHKHVTTLPRSTITKYLLAKNT